jgi:hypothetical protein
MANRFYVVSIRAHDESCIVVCVVVRAQARRAIVLATRLQGRAIKGIDLPAIRGRERQVKRRWLFLGLEQAQGNLVVSAELDAVRRHALSDDNHAQRLESLEEERPARSKVADSEFDVVKHGLCLFSGRNALADALEELVDSGFAHAPGIRELSSLG